MNSKYTKYFYIWLVSFFYSISLGAETLQDRINKLVLPTGYKIDVYASSVTNAREMAVSENGIVYVGSRSAGVVHALIDSDGNGKAESVIQILDGLTSPSGLAIYQGDLYVSEIDRVLKFADIDNNYQDPPQAEVIVDGLPQAREHGWKYIDFGPDGWLYVPVGAPCNICDPNHGNRYNDPHYSSIMRFNLETGEKQWVARGVRNSVGFDWHPETHNLWFSDNGRDMMGDDLPPCEINEVTEFGQHFGYPYFHGGSVTSPIVDSVYGMGKDSRNYVFPKQNLMAHVAPLGIHFYEGDMFAKGMKNRLFVAEHGSWNRTTKSGYRVMMANIQNNEVVSYTPFVEGWLNKTTDVAWGRPAAITSLQDGSLLIADDFADVIYRVTYNSE